VQQWQGNNQLTGQWKLSPVGAPTFSTTIQAEVYGGMCGIQAEATTDSADGQNVGCIDAGDRLAYSNVRIPTTGSYLIEYRVASPGSATLSADLNAGALPLGTVAVPAIGSWQSWTTVSQTVVLNAGTYNFGVYAQKGGWNFNWLRISWPVSARPTTLIAAKANPTDVTNLQLYPKSGHRLAANQLGAKSGRQHVSDSVGLTQKA